MSMRSQVYEWSNLAPGTVAGGGVGSVLNRSQNDLPVQVPANVSTDIFIGGIGNNITKPAETTATQFIVIEDISCTPDLAGSVQVRINTTDYFQNPDVTQMNGVPGTASPYPRGAPSVNPTGTGANTATGTVITTFPDNLLKSFDLYPDIYVLPGQVFQILYTTVQGTGATQFAANTAGQVHSRVAMGQTQPAADEQLNRRRPPDLGPDPALQLVRNDELRRHLGSEHSQLASTGL